MADLKKRVFHPIYFLMGEEPYFIDRVANYIEENVLNSNEKEFNQTLMYGQDADMTTILGAAKRFPMMANHQVVLIKEAQNVKDLIGKEKNDKSSSPFLHYLGNPQTSTILVFCYKYKTIDKRTALAKAIAKNTILLESKKLYDDKIPAWIKEYIEERNYTTSPDAATMLAEYLGNDLSKIANELDKLMINIAAKTEITIAHIQKNIGISKEYNIFELQKALGQKNVLKANRIINYFSANPKDHSLVQTITMIHTYFIKILKYVSLPDKSRNLAAAALGVTPFFVEEYEKAGRNYTINKLKAIFSYLREYDLKSKGINNATATEAELLKELIFKIIH